jgi:hypothetical protein
MILHHHALKAKSVFKRSTKNRRGNRRLHTILLNKTHPYKVLHQRDRWPCSIDLSITMLPQQFHKQTPHQGPMHNKVILTWDETTRSRACTHHLAGCLTSRDGPGASFSLFVEGATGEAAPSRLLATSPSLSRADLSPSSLPPTPSCETRVHGTSVIP